MLTSGSFPAGAGATIPNQWYLARRGLSHAMHAGAVLTYLADSFCGILYFTSDRVLGTGWPNTPPRRVLFLARVALIFHLACTSAVQQMYIITSTIGSLCTSSVSSALFLWFCFVALLPHFMTMDYQQPGSLPLVRGGYSHTSAQYLHLPIQRSISGRLSTNSFPGARFARNTLLRYLG